MGTQSYAIQNKDGSTISVSVRRDKRLKKTARWQWESKDTILLRVPHRLPKRVIQQHVDQIEQQLAKQSRLAERRTDNELQVRAERINRQYFGGKIGWRAIRWVGNMNTRLGSCTTGGPTDGHIRISEKIRHWPQWVVDYVIAHELVHRLHANHSPEFWETLKNSYPLTDRARGFIQGVGFAEGTRFEDGD
jgi:predicted metal-dependent hydrolase